MVDDAQKSAADLMSNANAYLSDAQQTVEQLLSEAKSTAQQLLDTARERATRESTELIDNAQRQAKALQQAANEYREQALAAVANHREVLNDLSQRITALREQWAQSHIAITEQVARAGSHFAQAENKANELNASLQERREELTNMMSGIFSGIRIADEDNESSADNQ